MIWIYINIYGWSSVLLSRFRLLKLSSALSSLLHSQSIALNFSTFPPLTLSATHINYNYISSWLLLLPSCGELEALNRSKSKWTGRDSMKNWLIVIVVCRDGTSDKNSSPLRACLNMPAKSVSVSTNHFWKFKMVGYALGNVKIRKQEYSAPWR